MIIKPVELNNKSRKGIYLYIKEKGNKGAYYKLKEETPKEYYIERYEQTYKKQQKEKGKRRKYQEKKKYTPKKITSLEKAISKGITKVKIKNIETTNQATITKAKKQLLYQLVRDEQLLQIIIQQQNIEKIKHRLEYNINIKDTEGKTLMTTGIIGQTPETVIKKLKEALQIKEKIKKGYQNRIAEALQAKGFRKPEATNDGYPQKTEIEITFRKNK